MRATRLVIGDVVREMVPLLDPSTSVQDAIRLMLRDGYAELPIGRNGRLEGVVGEHDLVAALLVTRSPSLIAIRELIPEEYAVGRIDQPLVEALTLLVRYRLQRLAVVAEDDDFLGMICDTDVASLMEQRRHREVAAGARATSARRKPLRLVLEQPE